MARYLYSELSAVVEARLICIRKNQRMVVEDGRWQARRKPDTEIDQNAAVWEDTHEATIAHLVDDLMPSGSGFDNGTRIDLDRSHAEKLVFTTSYHHMNDGGYYDGWTDHVITVTPSFRGVNIRVSGRNRNGLADIVFDTFDHALKTEVEWDKASERWYAPELRKAAEEYGYKVKTGEIA